MVIGGFPGLAPFHSSHLTLHFRSLSHLMNVRQTAATSAWKRAGGEGRQWRRLDSVAHAHTSTGLSMRGGLGLVVAQEDFSEHTPPSWRGVFDEAISRVSERVSGTLPAARWASPLLRGATPLNAPCRRPRPVGAMTCFAVRWLTLILRRGLA